MISSYSNKQFISREQVVDYARAKIKSNPIYLDTETTGLENSDEIIEIAIVNSEGNVVFESFIRPKKSIPASATAINHITNQMVSDSPTWMDIWPEIKSLLRSHPIGMYNAEFDIRLILQTMAIYKIPNETKFDAFDIMKVYSDYMRADRRYRLEQAGRNLGIPIPNSHRAADDTLLTRAVFHAIAGIPF